MHHIHRYLANLLLLLPLWAGAQVNRDACPGDPPTWCYVEGLPGSTFEWWAPNAEILQRDNNRILVRWPGPGHYVLKVIETSPEGCTGDTVWANVLVRPAGDGDCVPTLDVPNIFTPNGDTRNDLFAVRGTHLVVYQMQIFNRWGDLVYRTATPDDAWDGTTFANQPATEGQYFWVVQYGDGKNQFSQKGTVYLKR